MRYASSIIVCFRRQAWDLYEVLGVQLDATKWRPADIRRHSIGGTVTGESLRGSVEGAFRQPRWTWSVVGRLLSGGVAVWLEERVFISLGGYAWTLSRKYSAGYHGIT